MTPATDTAWRTDDRSVRRSALCTASSSIRGEVTEMRTSRCFVVLPFPAVRQRLPGPGASARLPGVAEVAIAMVNWTKHLIGACYSLYGPWFSSTLALTVPSWCCDDGPKYSPLSHPPPLLLPASCSTPVFGIAMGFATFHMWRSGMLEGPEVPSVQVRPWPHHPRYQPRLDATPSPNALPLDIAYATGSCVPSLVHADRRGPNAAVPSGEPTRV